MSDTRILQRYLPEAAIAPFLDYWQRNRLALHISRERSSKLGDYRLPTPDHPQHAISVNGSLNRYMFLWVLLHEMAHLDTFVSYGRDVSPHGHEWQHAYALQMQAYLQCFPAEAQPLIAQYSRTMPLNRRLKSQIERTLTHYGSTEAPVDLLDDQPEGTLFRLKRDPGRQFQSIEKRRTRWLCLCLENGKKYLVPGTAEIIKTQ